jgi:hypothetical protein
MAGRRRVGFFSVWSGWGVKKKLGHCPVCGFYVRNSLLPYKSVPICPLPLHRGQIIHSRRWACAEGALGLDIGGFSLSTLPVPLQSGQRAIIGIYILQSLANSHYNLRVALRRAM